MKHNSQGAILQRSFNIVGRLSSGIFTLSPMLSVCAGVDTSVPVIDKSLLIEISSV